MRWKGREQSRNVEDRRGQTVRGGGGGAVAGGAIGSVLFMLFRKGSLKTKMMLVLAVIAGCFFFKINPINLFMSTPGGSSQIVERKDYQPTAEEQEMLDYLETMKRDNEIIWTKIFTEQGWPTYRPSKLVVYRGKTELPGGGIADSRTGPFYMPANEGIYLDPSFFQELSQQFGAKGDFAQAYVMAHEVAHHVQKLLGLTDRVHSLKEGTQRNQMSVRLELQADFLAGVFAHRAQERFNFLEQGDIEEAIQCAKAIGDDTIQRKSQGYVQPHLFTHGTSEQRKRWFIKGFQTGDLSQGDTFKMGYEDL